MILHKNDDEMYKKISNMRIFNKKLSTNKLCTANALFKHILRLAYRREK